MKVHQRAVLVLALVAAGFAVRMAAAAEGDNKVDTRVFEIRTYYTVPGRMQALHARFRDHTCKIFKKHNMTLIGFWSPQDPKQAEEKMIYILAFPSREAADKSWKAFRDDPEWKAARDASEKSGKIVDRVESVFVTATDYSPLK